MALNEVLPTALLAIGSHFLTAWTSSCSFPSGTEQLSWPRFLWTYFNFLLFSHCPQRVIIASVHLLFVLILVLLTISRFVNLRRQKPAIPNGSNHSSISNRGIIGNLMNGRTVPGAKTVRVSFLFTTTCVVISLVALVHVGVTAWRIGYGYMYGWENLPAQELVFSVSQALAWLAFGIIAGHEKKFRAVSHAPVLRVWWVFTFFLSSLLLWSTVSRFLHHCPRTLQLWVDDIVILASFPVVVFLLVMAIAGATGIILEESELTESLLGEQDGDHRPAAANVTQFYTASFLSKLTWLWLNPLLKVGNIKALQPEDVPLLTPDDRAEEVYRKFMCRYSTQSEPRSARLALFKTFWPQLTFTALLALIKIAVMYVGPLLISPIVDFVGGKELFPYEGWVLVFLLFIAKTTEVLASHHYNFFSQKLGMVIRSSLITTVYRKGLHLSSHARQIHGAGQIVNYMSVDVQQIADCLVQLHNLWILPIQIAVALIILFGVVGVACVGGIVTMLIVMSITFNNSRFQRIFQARIMRSKDERMAATTEVLNSMRVIKLQSWEDHFKDKIEKIRSSERHWLIRFQYVLAGNIFFLWQSPVLVAVATFALCVWLHEELTPVRVFTAISTFRIMQDPLRLFPQALMNISQALNSLDRLDKYFWSEELDPDVVEKVVNGDGKHAVEIEAANFRWNEEEERPTLSNIDFKAPRGSLVAIVGMVGSGKSSLLAAVLGEIPKLAGKVKVSGTTAYVAQSAWIQNANIKDNILFGQPLNHAKYQEALRVCSLQEDLRQMPFGDQTEIGERGINLSGGQKQRIQLARAVYFDADIYLLDDVFSAVDAHTGSELFENCIKKALGSRTVLLVTHQVEFLGQTDLILVMRDGKIVQSGKYEDLIEAGTDLGALVAAHHEALDKVDMSDSDEDEEVLVDDLDPHLTPMKSPPQLIKSPSQVPKSPTKQKSLQRQGTSRQSGRNLIKLDSKATSRKGQAKLIDDEKREVGQVGWRVYWLYATKFYFGTWVVLLLIFQTCWQGLQIAGDFYLANATSVSNADEFKPKQFIATYSEFAFGSGVFVLLRTFLLAFSGLKTSQSFFISLLSRIMRGTMAFFDTTPSGRILTRFGTDQSNVDFLIPILFGTVLGQGFQALGILVVVCKVTWQLLIFVLPLSIVYIFYQSTLLLLGLSGTRRVQVIKG